MNPHEWALIVFTVVMQMAVGSFVVLGGAHFFAARRNGIDEADKLSDRALLAIGPVVVFALIVTLFHVGNPLNAPRAIANIGTSWLSREIALSLVFAVGGAVFAFMQWRKISTASVRNVVALVVAAIGLVLVFAMSMIYQLATVPAWDTLATPVTFYLTAFLLGAMAMGAAFIANFWYLRRNNRDPHNVQYMMLATSLRWITLISIGLLGLQFLVVPLYLTQLSSTASPAAQASVASLSESSSIILTVRLILLFVGAGLLSVFVYQNASSESKLRIVGNIAYVAFVLVLVSEVLGRYLFYSSMVKIGL
ncbi:MAG: dimethyl sulfoxide reductase anchor subunit [Anaerolineae bacterium]|nr:dimethyl sulfoxide reductase anchor subunit [Anaerolineae bacterium]